MMVLTRVFRIAVVCALPLLLLTCLVSASSGRPNEITDIHFENVTQATPRRSVEHCTPQHLAGHDCA